VRGEHLLPASLGARPVAGSNENRD